ncbi:MAG: hypothetical protein OEZ43_07400 [Gammaproteobacteria bacterium]|nr:hypothetical protein [Gammaproteobacteria bacterium]
MNNLIVFLGLLLVASCTQSLDTNNRIAVVSVDQAGTDENKAEFCSDFNLSKADAQSYFDKAEVISAETMHDEFEFLPCFVRGKCQLNDKSCQWEIRAGGVAHVDFGEKTEIYGCNSCPGF